MAREFRIRTCLECANYVPRHTEVIGNKPDPECPCILVPDELPEHLRLLDDCINKAEEILDYLDKKEKDESK